MIAHQDIINVKEDFFKVALDIFEFQKKHNPIYAAYLDAIQYNKVPSLIIDFPFLPISFYKTHQVVAAEAPFDIAFKSSGTTGVTTSRHFVKDLNLYHRSFTQAFEYFYGKADQYCILGLLPSYLEQGESSLVYMVQQLIDHSIYKESSTFLHQVEKLQQQLLYNIEHKIPTLVFGVTYALLDFAEQYPMPLPDFIIIMETGGMKGRREELTRAQVHGILTHAFQQENIHSEYGMTELLSQAYSQGKGIYRCPPQMQILLREINDPFSLSTQGRGLIDIIDLANRNSCSFIATDDLGTIFPDGSFTVDGRLAGADLRGCSLMAI